MIIIKGLEIKYGSFAAMRDLNLEIKEGEFFTLLGPSGCGKTSVLRTITGFIKPSKGKIVLAGKDVTDIPVEKRDVGIVFQSYALFPTMNVFENIAFGLRVAKYKEKQINGMVIDIAEKVDLNPEQLYRNAAELSGGQQQRVAIARALVMKPKILCLDEPLSNLDAKLRHQLRNELKELQLRFGITTVYVTHDQEEALTLSDRIAVFNNGYLEQVGTPSEVYFNPGSEFVSTFLGDINRLPPGLFGKDKNTECFVRLNDVHSQEIDSAGKMAFDASIVGISFFGLYYKITYRTADGFQLSNTSINCSHRVGDRLSLFIDSSKVIFLHGGDTIDGK
jgi:iron(III) transport system ATP-binding protein